MSVMRIDDHYLGKKCKDVKPEEDVTSLIAGMLSTCWMNGKQIAVGLAANQVGSNLRVIVIDYGGFRGGMINPFIKRYRGGTCVAKEECLSFKGKSAYVSRHKIVKVNWLDTNHEAHMATFRGLLARIIQHEIDHVDGITMLDREEKL